MVLVKKREKNNSKGKKHMSNYLKKTLFTILIFMMPYMNSVSNAMDGEDYKGSGVRARNVSFVTEDRQDVSSSVQQSTSSQVEGLEESPTSWSSYLISPVKSVFQGTYEIMDFAIKRPKIATLIGLSYMISVAAAANCTGCYQCDCICVDMSCRTCIKPYGNVPDVNSCINVCNALGNYFSSCK